jgi:hypothetical protein
MKRHLLNDLRGRGGQGESGGHGGRMASLGRWQNGLESASRRLNR